VTIFSKLNCGLTFHRDSSVKIGYRTLSEVSFANRQAVTILWTKSQELPDEPTTQDVEVAADGSEFTFQMMTIATPDAEQSKAYIATYALFHIFASSPKEEKAFLRLPPAWRELWSELAEAKKEYVDRKDRKAVKELRDLVRKRQDQDLEDGVILQGAFRGRGAGRNTRDGDQDSSQDRVKHVEANPEYYQRIWYDKSSTPKFHHMLVS